MYRYLLKLDEDLIIFQCNFDSSFKLVKNFNFKILDNFVFFSNYLENFAQTLQKITYLMINALIRISICLSIVVTFISPLVDTQ